MKCFVIFLILVSFSVSAFAESVPEPETQGNSTAYENCGPETTLQDGTCVADKTKEITTDKSICWGGLACHYAKPPLEQIKSGVPLDKIVCKESLVLVTKYNGLPACVKPETKERLVERGWTAQDYHKVIHPSWEYQLDKKISSIAISDDSSVIAVGTGTTPYSDNYFYLFGNNGTLLWRHNVDQMISDISISSDTSRIAVSAFQYCGGGGGAQWGCNSSIHVFDIKGNPIWSYELKDSNDAIGSVKIIPDNMDLRVVTNSKIMYFDIQGNITLEYAAENSSGRTLFSKDGSFILTSEGQDIIFLNKNGQKLWSFHQEYEFNYSNAMSEDGKYVISSDSDGSRGNIYFLGNNGSLLWKKPVEEAVVNLAISDDNSSIVASTNWQFMLLDSLGNMQWINNIPSQVEISSDGSFLAGITFNQGQGSSVTLFDRKGNILSEDAIGSQSISLLSADDKHLAVANEDQQTILFFDIVNETTMPKRIDLFDMQNSDSLHVQIIPENQNGFDVVVEQGKTKHIPWDVKMDDNYATTNLSLSIKSPLSLESWITPPDPYTTINGVPPGDRVITIHPGIDTAPGNYTVIISGSGYSVHNQTGWMTNLEGQTLGDIQVTVVPQKSELSIEIGSTHYEQQTFCVKLDESNGGGTFCSGGQTYQEIPVTVFSDTKSAVHLSAFGIKGGWVKFVPEDLVVGPEGATTKMIMAGNMVSFQTNLLADKPLTIQATSKNESTTAIIPVRPGDISVISKVSPIHLNSIRTNSNSTNFSVSGVVYDPENDASLPVKLSVLGMWDDKLAHMPKWLEITIPEPSFVLDAAKPYHFMIAAKTVNAPESGTFLVAINENIDGQNFVELLDVTIENIWH